MSDPNLLGGHPGPDYFLDLRLQPDPEFSAPMLMSALFAKLHRALTRQRDPSAPDALLGRIGLSFPQHAKGKAGLGAVMRLHGSQASLIQLMETTWLQGARDHLADAGPAPLPVPETVKGYRPVLRVQADSNPERLRRRLMRRHPDDIDADQARARIPDEAAKQLDLPFVALTSTSTGQHFRLFIQHGPVQAAPQPGSFSAYGLSLQGSTVPWF